MKTLNTIRFKLTLLYSVVLFLFCGGFVLGVNIYLVNYIKTDPAIPPMSNSAMPMDTIAPGGRLQRFKDLTKEEQQRIQSIRENDVKRIRIISLLALIPLIVLSSFGGYYLSGRLLSPLQILNKHIKKLKAENLNHQIDYYTAKDEVGELIANYNDMIQRLNVSFEQQSQFVQDASHEIKTPLAIIQTNLDTVLSDKDASNNELRKAITYAIKGVESLNELTEELLSLSLPNGYKLDNIDLVKVVFDQIESLKPFAKQNKVELKFSEMIDELHVQGNEFFLGRAFYNLIENAIKYSKDVEKPLVSVTIEKIDKNRFKLIIKDNGKGIPKKDIPFIFERFYRVDKARSRKEGGFGLGLAIVKKVIDEHGWKIGVNSSEGETAFIIEN